MTRKGIQDDWSDLPEDVSEEDFEQIQDFLQKYEVKYPDSEEINRTVEEVRIYLVMNTSKKQGIWVRSKQLLRIAASEVSIMRSYYWIISAILYLVGYIMLGLKIDLSPTFILFVLSPIPFILGMIEMFRSRDEGMMEMEMSCTFSGASVMLAKLCVISSYNIVLNVIAAFFYISQSEGSFIGNITLMWLTPFTIISGLSLLISIRLRSHTAVLCMLSIWISFCLIIISNSNLMRNILSMHKSSYLTLILLGVLLTFIQAASLVKRMREREGGISFEINH